MRTVLMLLLVIPLGFTAAHAQAQYTVRGKITDKAGDPVPYCLITIKQSGLKVISDNAGNFFFSSISLPATAMVSFTGYKTQEKEIYAPPGGGSVVVLHIKLSEDIHVFREFTVSDKPYQIIHKESRTTTLDYDFMNDQIILLTSNSSGYQIKYITLFDQAIDQYQLWFKPQGLFTDCLGNIHVLAKDSVYQLYTYNLKIHLMPGIERTVFENVLRPCVARYNESLVLREYGTFRQSVLYYSVEKGKERVVIDEITDKELNTFVEHYFFAKINGQSTDGLIMENRGNSREVFQNQSFYKSVLSIATYHPLFLHDSLLLLFDHYNGYIKHIQSGTIREAVPITYHTDKTWQTNILFDAPSGKFYTLRRVDGIFILRQIDIDTGNEGRSFPISEQTFPEKIRVHDNRLFYLYKSKEKGTYVELYSRRL